MEFKYEPKDMSNYLENNANKIFDMFDELTTFFGVPKLHRKSKNNSNQESNKKNKSIE